jgi:uncharacterized protein YdeI (YjbR/CyaY-like superfamily)
MNSKVDAFLATADKWQKEMSQLRTILLACELTEELKWGKPCYSFRNNNVVLIVPFKDSCALLLTKGALLKDPQQILIQPTENTQSARQIRFTSVREIVKMETTLKAYINEAIAAEKAGKEVKFKKVSEFAVPEEFQNKLDESPDLKAAFHALTPGRQRAYLLYFAGAKQPKTREARVDKCLQNILRGKGLDD